MNGPQVELPRYQCHKKVHAAKITALETIPDPADPDNSWKTKLVFGDDGAYSIPSSAWIAKNNPQVGGYYVLYEDGYTSYSPAKAFEEGYTRLTKS